MRKRIYETPRGYVEEEGNVIFLYTYGLASYDGIIDKFVSETRINYETGLYQEWTSTNYYANYFDKYKGNREKALEEAFKQLGWKGR